MSNFSKISFEECKQMSSRLIAMNPNRNANMGKISTHLLDYYTELTKQPWLCTLVGQIRDLTAKQKQMLQQAAEAVDAAQYQNDDDLAFAIIKKQEEMKTGDAYKQLDKQVGFLKKQLPFRSPHYYHFLDDHRAQKTIDPAAFTFQTTVDIDNPEEVETAVKNALLLNGMFDDAEEKLFREKIFSADDIELWKGKVLHVERSARNKAHIDIRIPVGMTIAEAQSAFCKLIHATEDPSCVTPERIIFITDATSQIYTADDWYKRLDEETVAEYREAYRKRGLDIDGRPLDISSSSSSSAAPTVDFQPIESEEEKARKAANTVQYEQTYEGIPYEVIVKELAAQIGPDPATGNRNNFIYREALYLRYICNNDPEWIKQVILIYGEDEQKAGDAFLYCKMDEVDMLKKFNDPSQLIRCCWDCSLDGQERVGVKSVTAQVKTRFNWNASSTIAVTQKFFSVREVADGAVSRLSLATIIRPDFAPRPVVGEYDALFKAQLAPYIHHLNGTSGFKDCKKARLLIERLENEIMETAQLAYNKPYAEFAKRGLANGFRRAMVLYLANGEKWEKPIEDFIEWSVKYDLWCKMRFFGNQMQEAIDADSQMVYHATGVSNLLLYVHDTFDKVEIQRVCQIHGTKTKLAILLCNWKKRGFIVKNEDGTFSKTAKFIGKYGHYGTPGMAA